MKYETKYKILRFVEKLLKWDAVDGRYFIIRKEEQKIEIVRASYTVTEQEYKQLTQDQLEYTIGTCLMEGIRKSKLMTIEVEKSKHDQYCDGLPYVQINAFVRIVNPKRL